MNMIHPPTPTFVGKLTLIAVIHTKLRATHNPSIVWIFSGGCFPKQSHNRLAASAMVAKNGVLSEVALTPLHAKRFLAR